MTKSIRILWTGDVLNKSKSNFYLLFLWGEKLPDLRGADYYANVTVGGQDLPIVDLLCSPLLHRNHWNASCVGLLLIWNALPAQNVQINALQTALLFLVMKQGQKDYESLFKCLLIHLKQPSSWTAARELFSVISVSGKAWGDNPFPDWPALCMWKIYGRPLIWQIKFFKI